MTARVVIEIRCYECDALIAEVSVEDMDYTSAIKTACPVCNKFASITLCPIIQIPTD